MGGLLSMVGTPIGNLGDASARMVDTLRAADVILCEDTRVTARLLAHFGVHAPLLRADEGTLDRRVGSVIERIIAGERVAYACDAGMPGVSDPGQRLVDAVLDAGLSVEVVPGPSAVTAALVASGLPMARFFFEGFLPRRPGALARRLRELAMIPATIVAYESPRRAPATLAAIASALPSRRVALARELTKLHEEVVRGDAPAVAAAIAARGELRGECVIVIGPPAVDAPQADEPGAPSFDEAASSGLAAGEAKSALAKRLAKTYGMSRSRAYDLVVACARRG